MEEFDNVSRSQATLFYCGPSTTHRPVEVFSFDPMRNGFCQNPLLEAVRNAALRKNNIVQFPLWDETLACSLTDVEFPQLLF